MLREHTELVGEFDVGTENDALPVRGFRGQVYHFVEMPVERGLAAAHAFILGDGVGARMENEQAAVAVEQCVIAIRRLLRDIREADHGGNAHAAGHDGTVTGVTAAGAGKSEHPRAVHGRCLAGGDFLREENVRLLRGHLRGITAQHAHHAARDVREVRDALAQVVVIHAAHGVHVAAHHLPECALGPLRIAPQEPVHAIEQRRVFQHQQVGIEDKGIVSSRLHRHAVAQDFQLPARLGNAGMEARQLRLGLLRRDGGALRFIEERRAQAHWPAGDSRRNADPDEHHFLRRAVSFLRHGRGYNDHARGSARRLYPACRGAGC